MADMRRDTLLDLFDSFAELGDLALIHDDGLLLRRFTYREVAAAAKGMAARLQAAGVGKSDRVLLWSENRAEWIAALWGILLAGAVAVPIDYRSSFSLVERIQQQVQAKVALIGDQVTWPDGGMPESLSPQRWKLRALDWNGRDMGARPEIAKDDLAEIIFTSGTTGEPKGVLITHRNVLANLIPVEREIQKYRSWGRIFFPVRFLNLLPLSHMFGQAMAAFIPPMLPGVVMFLNSQNPQEIVHQVHQQRVSVIVGVPRMLELLQEYFFALYPELEHARPEGLPWPRKWWRYRKVHRRLGWKFWAFVVGAAPLPPELEKFWNLLGFLVVQGYGLTETAPIVTLNHPFHAKAGTVGKPMPGVEMKLAEDGEILVRGENVSRGYFGQEQPEAAAPEGKTHEGKTSDRWLHTGDIGEMNADGELIIRGRKKDVIVTPEGMNVFPEDIEEVLDGIPGVKESAVVGPNRVHAVVILDPGTKPEDVVAQANRQLEQHQRIQNLSVWPEAELPRSAGTRKLLRRKVLEWVQSGGTKVPESAAGPLESMLASYAPAAGIRPDTKLEDLALTSLDRVDLMVRLGISENAFQNSSTIADLSSAAEHSSAAAATPDESEEIGNWPRSFPARLVRDASLATWILPLDRIFAHLKVAGREHLKGIRTPVIFAANHQSYMDGPSILAALPFHWRRRVAIAASKEFFAPHFHPDQYSMTERLRNTLAYVLGSLFFHLFPLPQREAGAMASLKHAGRLVSDGWSILIFPEGIMTEDGTIRPFQPGVGMLAAKLGVPVVPVRIEGLDKVLQKHWKFPSPGPVSVTFGAPLRLEGDRYAELAGRVEHAVRDLGSQTTPAK